MIVIKNNYENINPKNFLINMILTRDNKKFSYKAQKIINNTLTKLEKKGSIVLTEQEIDKIIEISKKRDKPLLGINKIIEERFKHLTRNICESLGFNYEALKSKSRKRELVETRQLIWRYAREMINYTPISKSDFLDIIGGFFNRDRSTVLHGIKCTHEIPSLKKEYSNLFNHLNSINNE